MDVSLVQKTSFKECHAEMTITLEDNNFIWLTVTVEASHICFGVLGCFSYTEQGLGPCLSQCSCAAVLMASVDRGKDHSEPVV